MVLNGFDAMKEGLVVNGDSMVDRPVLALQDEITGGLGRTRILKIKLEYAYCNS